MTAVPQDPPIPPKAPIAPLDARAPDLEAGEEQPSGSQPDGGPGSRTLTASAVPAGAVQVRPSRPRPAVWSSVVTTW